MSAPAPRFDRRLVIFGLRISIASAGWTLIAGGGSIAVGIMFRGLALAAFGAIGLMDAMGSVSLIVHFRHALRSGVLSERKEAIALWLVRSGMVAVGAGALVASVLRLVAHSSAEPSLAGVIIAGISMSVLAVLALSKHAIARRIPSPALRADGWLSAVGACLAVVTLVGATLQGVLGWWWLDAAAAGAVGLGAVILGLVQPGHRG